MSLKKTVYPKAYMIASEIFPLGKKVPVNCSFTFLGFENLRLAALGDETTGVLPAGTAEPTPMEALSASSQAVVAAVAKVRDNKTGETIWLDKTEYQTVLLAKCNECCIS